MVIAMLKEYQETKNKEAAKIKNRRGKK